MITLVLKHAYFHLVIILKQFIVVYSELVHSTGMIKNELTLLIHYLIPVRIVTVVSNTNLVESILMCLLTLCHS